MLIEDLALELLLNRSVM